MAHLLGHMPVPDSGASLGRSSTLKLELIPCWSKIVGFRKINTRPRCLLLNVRTCFYPKPLLKHCNQCGSDCKKKHCTTATFQKQPDRKLWESEDKLTYETKSFDETWRGVSPSPDNHNTERALSAFHVTLFSGQIWLKLVHSSLPTGASDVRLGEVESF